MHGVGTAHRNLAILAPTHKFRQGPNLSLIQFRYENINASQCLSKQKRFAVLVSVVFIYHPWPLTKLASVFTRFREYDDGARWPYFYLFNKLRALPTGRTLNHVGDDHCGLEFIRHAVGYLGQTPVQHKRHCCVSQCNDHSHERNGMFEGFDCMRPRIQHRDC
jgi:hypothetical protein